MPTILEETAILVKKLIDNYRPEKIILFGSVARNQHTNNSDIDLLIIKKSEKKRPFRIKAVFEALRGIKRNYPLDPLVYTPDEIKKRLSIGDYFIKRVLNEGKILYGQ